LFSSIYKTKQQPRTAYHFELFYPNQPPKAPQLRYLPYVKPSLALPRRSRQGRSSPRVLPGFVNVQRDEIVLYTARAFRQ